MIGPVVTFGFGSFGSVALVSRFGFSAGEAAAPTGDPLDASFRQRRSGFHTRVTQRRLGTTTQGRMGFEENDSVETE